MQTLDSNSKIPPSKSASRNDEINAIRASQQSPAGTTLSEKAPGGVSSRGEDGTKHDVTERNQRVIHVLLARMHL